MSSSALTYAFNLKISPNGQKIVARERWLLSIIADNEVDMHGLCINTIGYLVEQSLFTYEQVLSTIDSLRTKKVIAVIDPDSLDWVESNRDPEDVYFQIMDLKQSRFVAEAGVPYG